jgi:hypothetical protein
MVDNHILHNDAEVTLTLSNGTYSGYIALRWATPATASILYVTTLTQTAGTTYDIPLASVTVTSNVVTYLEDARFFVQGSIGPNVPRLYRRQGGDATAWATSGTNDYIPSLHPRMQAGSIYVTAYGAVEVTFPVAFSATPIVMVEPVSGGDCDVRVYNVAADKMTITQSSFETGAALAGDVHWLAIGPK